MQDRSKVTVVEVTDEVEDKNGDEIESSREDVAMPQQAPPAFNPAYPSSTLSIYNANLASQPSSIPASIKQQVKETDDSKTAYGERFASTFGDKRFAPMPAPSAPSLDNPDWEEYQAWMNAPSFAARKDFPNHARWNDTLQQNQERFRLDSATAFHDKISQKFRDKIIAEQKESKLLNGHGLPPSYIAVPVYRPPVFEAEISAEIKDDAPAPYFDQIQAMMEYTDQHFKVSHFKGKFIGQKIASNHFFVTSDHGGKISGKNLQIWGAGVKESLDVASLKSKQSIDKVEGSLDSYDAVTSYAHVPNRFTIIRIDPNEIGFVFDRVMNAIEKIKPGRYLIPEYSYAYIGKTALHPGNAALVVPPHNAQDPITVKLAAQLQIVLVSPGKTAFIKDNYNTYMLPENVEPYILDKRRGEEFINFESMNQQLIRAADGSYTVINNLRPGQFVLFQYQSQVMVWPFDKENPALNTLYLPSNQFRVEAEIRNINNNHVHWMDAHVICMKPGQVSVVQNEEREIQFIENSKLNMFVLRSPWQFVGFANKNQIEYRAGTQVAGNETVRLMLRSSEWAAILSESGQLSFYPPRLDNQPYYFSQPENTLIGIIDKNKPGKQQLDVPGIGVVSVVNIPSGQIGACLMGNMHFFLNPSPTPYIFMPPDKFIDLIDAKASHAPNGDLHRVVLAPDEQAVIIKDGQLYRLPSDDAELRGENGVYVFRAGQFSFQGGDGPKKKSEKDCHLGPIHYFIVDIGEVGYGACDGRPKIWDVGHHFVDNRKNEWFTGFFTTNVDPVDIKDVDVTFKHGITGKIDVFVSYHIANAEKAIQQFKDHNVLHKFIETTTRAEMLKLCAIRPPLGYTDLDFTSYEMKSAAPLKNTEKNVSEAVKEMQEKFLSHAETLREKYGVSISDMYINAWALDKDFVKQVQENAKSLQNAHADVERAQIALQRAELENKKAQQIKENEIKLGELDNKKLELTLEANRLTQLSDTKTGVDKQLAQASAEAEARKRSAQADADIKSLTAKASVETAEQTALASTAEERVKAKIQQEIAENRLNAKKSEAEAEKVAIGVREAEGTVEARVAGLKEQARFTGLSAEQRLQLQLAEVSAKNITDLLRLLTQANMQMPGVLTLDPKILEIYQMPAIAAAQAAQRNATTSFGLFAVPSSAPQPIHAPSPSHPSVELKAS